MKSYLVFSYGSNMNPRQMQDRCPGAEPFCVARLKGYRLTFVGSSSRWGGGVATIVPDPRSSVVGIVWQLSGANLRRLDAFEGFPYAYDREWIDVETEDGQEVICQTYVYQDARARLSAPSALYLRTILAGYDWAGVRPSTRLNRMFAEVKHGAAA